MIMREAVVEVCQRLDGVPLAIELAAARVIALSPARTRRRLDRRFQVLAGGRRGAVERHATLRAAIDWSYELLNSPEQRLLARMAVFPGAARSRPLRKICSGDPVERDDVMDLVTGLVSRSLVVAEDSDLGTRFRLVGDHSPVRRGTARRLERDRAAADPACPVLCRPVGAGRRELLRARTTRLGQADQPRARQHPVGPRPRASTPANAALAVQLVADTILTTTATRGMGEVFEDPSRHGYSTCPTPATNPGTPAC